MTTQEWNKLTNEEKKAALDMVIMYLESAKVIIENLSEDFWKRKG